MHRINIIIATITRNRPKMLANLYQSLADLDIPLNIDAGFLIVENNTTSTSDDWLRDVSAMIDAHPVHYLLETNIGISSARNRALEFAERVGADFLVFVDDDELVQPDWLKQLLAEQQRGDLDIVGSPVRPMPLEKKLSPWQKLVWSGLEHQSVKAELRTRKKWQKNRAYSIKIATGSWMGKLDFFRKTGLRFEPNLDLSGGEDWRLWHQAAKLGAVTGWAPDAIAYETVPCSRISLSYHFRRERDISATQYAIQYKENRWQALKRVPSKILSRSLRLLSALCIMPFSTGQALLSSAKALGAIVGLLQACCGKRPMHYAKTTGF